RLNEASGPSKQASNLAGRLACKQVSKRARQSGKPGKQTGKLAASETQREKRKRGHMTSRMRRGWVREEGGRETTRTVREYIPQHGSIRRRRRYMELDQTGGERGGRLEHSGGNVRLAGSWEREVNGGQRELMGRQGRGLVEASVRLGGGRRATRSGRQAGERRKNRERREEREREGGRNVDVEQRGERNRMRRGVDGSSINEMLALHNKRYINKHQEKLNPQFYKTYYDFYVERRIQAIT
ncbi:unnamed protein product, partial [Heterotrigona itama]